MRDFERRYWRTLTFGEPPMYGADMAGSLFDDSTKAWNVAHLGDLLPKLAPRGCEIPGVVTPYLYFGMWRATFAWHVEDADLYSINYIHFGAPKFWYSVPQEQSERFERVMAGLFPTDRAKCNQFLRHKSFLASPKILSNNGITLNRCVQLPGEFILTYPKGYHSGFNLGFNCAESINFATERWLPLGKVTKHCRCIEDSCVAIPFRCSPSSASG
ncbi:JmjC domain, hydroxylase-domain-containing protein [Rhodotorula diobovata]|uniref:JmjC domain, hydroxylase-domain-containing protein n=1 Tax=Rhodotorula diobovata TaxID=5288 RepID=A0A5C5FZD9_9BASI|nr:JmjC domain, hydroxylase-domain-containing protein [Rhodotorula diobovata]